MKTMTIRTPFALLLALLAAVAAPAQDQAGGVARLKGLKGNVLLSREAGLVAGGEATRISEHTRVITTAGAEVVVAYDNGCEVRLKENQRFEVEVDKPCAQLVAQSILGEPPATALGAFWALVPAASGAAGGIYLLKDTGETPLSPS
jgi:hypothetical protein